MLRGWYSGQKKKAPQLEELSLHTYVAIYQANTSPYISALSILIRSSFR